MWLTENAHKFASAEQTSASTSAPTDRQSIRMRHVAKVVSQRIYEYEDCALPTQISFQVQFKPTANKKKAGRSWVEVSTSNPSNGGLRRRFPAGSVLLRRWN